MRAYIEHGMYTLPQPVLLYYYGPFFRHNKPQRGRYREFFQFGLEALGTSKNIIDAMIIQITTIILTEVGFKNLCVLVNNIGDKTCRPDYIKELTIYYRKHIDSLCPNCRQRIKNNPLRLLDCKDERCQEYKKEAPEIVGFLCDSCKQSFKEVLEYLDTMDIPYRIDNTLVRGIDYYACTVFEIVDEKDSSCDDNPSTSLDAVRHGSPQAARGKEQQRTTESDNDPSSSQDSLDTSGKPYGKQDQKTDKHDTSRDTAPPPLALASGGRYDYLAKQLGSKIDVPAVGVAIGVDRIIEMAGPQSLAPRILKKPKVYFIQIGFEAKLKSLMVIEILRKAKVPIIHSLSRDKLSVQLALAEKTKILHTIIIGQKEALDETVIVRNMSTRSQDTVKIEKLAEYMKKKI